MLKEKRTKYKINFFDICVILLALVCMASVVVRASIVSNEPKEYVIRFQIDDIKSSSYDYFFAGDTVRIKSSNEVLGVFNNDLTRQAGIFTYNDNKGGEEVKHYFYPSPVSGRFRFEERCSITGSITVMGNIKDNGFYVNDKILIDPNGTLNIISEHVEATIKITSIEAK